MTIGWKNVVWVCGWTSDSLEQIAYSCRLVSENMAPEENTEGIDVLATTFRSLP